MSGVAASSGSAGGSGTPLGGLGGSLEDKDCELVCPVCFDLIEEAYVTRCGHSFCFACIAKAVEVQRRCPKCGAALAGRDHIFPNFLLNELVNARRLRTRPNTATPPPGSSGQRLAAMLQAESARLDLPHVTSMLSVLTRRKRALEAESQAAQNRLLYEFLSHLHQHRKHQLEQLEREAALVEKDMEQVAASLKELNASTESLLLEPSTSQDTARRAKQDTFSSSSPTVPEEEESFGSAGASAGDALAARWRLLTQHFEDFVQCYFSHRSSSLYFGAPSAAPAPPAPLTNPEADSVPEVSAHDNGNGDQRAPEADTDLPPPERIRDRTRPAEREPQGLDAFKEDLVTFTRYRSLRPLATLSYCSDAINYSTIVSTIEFDKDEEFFAIAGVTKRIKVFEFESVVRDAVDVHYPCAEMQCTHKISCVSWNAYHKHILASSDYEGTVSVWDAATGQRTRALQEHDKRCWSVHFNQCDVRLLASGSDDARVKLWALNHERSVATLDAKYNVCCVRFNGGSSAHLAFGSADHCVHYYDLRSPRAPLGVFRDHRKAVSYVKFVSSRKLVSASTDSQLKLWSVDRPRHIRSFTGHANEKNFVGLATDGKYIACGSENNALYVYYSGLSKPLLSYKFDAVRGFLEKERRDEEPSEFVSAVCWRKAADRQILLAANSQGIIKVLELV